MSQHQFIGARDMMENEAISPFAVCDFVLPYSWVMSLGRSAITTLGGLCGRSAFGELANVFLKVLVFVVAIFVLWIPINLFYRAGSFFLASIVRLIKGVGGKQGLKTNLWFVGFYCFVFSFIYIPYIIPYFHGYIGWDSILLWLKIS